VALQIDSRSKSLKHGDHACAVFDDPDAQIQAMIEYITAGLTLGERCVYIIGNRVRSDIEGLLSAAGIDVGGALDSGNLVLTTTRETYLQDGVFDPDRMVRFLRDTEEEALQAGCNGLRLSGEMIWALGSEVGCDRVIEYESQLNRFFPGSHSLAICQYSRADFPAAILDEVLRTHPVAIVDQSAGWNPFYEPPHLALVSGVTERVNWKLSQLLHSRLTESELQAEVRKLDEFLSIASRELRMPLQALNLALHLADNGARSNESTRKHIARAQRQAERLNRLVGEVLDATRIRKGRLEWKLDTFDLKQLVEVASAYFDHGASGLSYTIQIDGESVWGRWDAERIGQILHYLLSNAIKFGAGKPIEVTIATRGAFADLTVTDHGIGIDAARLPRIFDHFGHASADSQHAGMGLGLWMVGRLVEAMHGSVHVRSELGCGSSFTVYLPLE
jgi:signal transduction histidine kinase